LGYFFIILLLERPFSEHGVRCNCELPEQRLEFLLFQSKLAVLLDETMDALEFSKSYLKKSFPFAISCCPSASNCIRPPPLVM